MTLDEVHAAARRVLDPDRAAIVDRRTVRSRRRSRRVSTCVTRAVFFDVDFTLIYPGPTFRGEGYQQFCARHGIEVDPSRFEAAVAAASRMLDEARDHIYDAAIFRRYTGRDHRGDGRRGPGGRRVRRGDLRRVGGVPHFELYDDVPAALRALARARHPHRPDLEHAPLPGVVPEPLRARRA